jgi:hypothetical protein
MARGARDGETNVPTEGHVKDYFERRGKIWVAPRLTPAIKP